MVKLYELTDDLMGLMEAIANGEITAEDAADTLDGIGGAIQEKVQSVAAMVRTLEAEAAMFEAEAKRLSDAKKARESAADNLKDYLRHNMDKAGVDKVAGLFSVSLGKASQVVVITDENAVPDAYAKYERKVSKSEVKAALESGVEVPGACFEQGKRRLVIK